MPSFVVTKHISQASKLLQPFVRRFMTCPDSWSHLMSVLGNAALRLACVPCVSQNLFTNSKLVNKILAKYADVRIFPTRKWAIRPHDITALDGNANLIPQTRTFELVRKPSFPKWFWLVDPKVSSINWNFARLSWIIDETIVPFYLELDSTISHNQFVRFNSAISQTKQKGTHHFWTNTGNCTDKNPRPFPKRLCTCSSNRFVDVCGAVYLQKHQSP